MRKRKIWILTTLGVTALAITLLAFVIAANAEPPDDADLRPRSEIAVANSGYGLFSRALAALTSPSRFSIQPGGYSAAGGDPDSPAFDLLKDHAVAIKLLHQAAEAGVVLPGVLRPEDPIPSLLDARSAVNLLLLEADRYELQGQHRKSLESRVTALEIGIGFTREPAVICVAIGLGLKQAVHASLRESLGRTRYSEQDLRWLRERLRESWFTRAMQEECLRREYWAACYVIDRYTQYAQGLGRPWLLKPNATKRGLARVYRILLADLDRLPANRQMKAEAQRLGQRTRSWTHWLRANPSGEELIALWPSDFLGQYDSARYLERGMDVIIALHLFERRTGSLPLNLEELVPAELDEVPIDPYVGAPIGWDPIAARLRAPAQTWDKAFTEVVIP